MQASSHGSKRAEAAESHWDTCQTQLRIIPEGRTPGENHVWSSSSAGDVVEGSFDMHLAQHKLRQVFHASTKVKSQPSLLPGNARRSPQLILDVLGRALPGGWLPGSKTALHVVRGANLPCKPGVMFSSPPCFIQRCVSC